MAIKYWNGEVEDHKYDYGYAGNWYPSGVPEDGDSVIVGAMSNAPILFSLDQSAVTLVDFETRKSYTGQIGTPATPLKLDVSTRMLLQGSADCYIDVSTDDTEKIVVDQVPGSAGVHHLTSGTTLKGVFSVSGEVRWTGNVALLYVTHTDVLPGNARFVLESGTAALVFSMAGLYEQISGTTTNLAITEGTSIIHGGVVTNISLGGSGTCDYRSTSIPTTIQANGTGLLTFANDPREKELGTIYLRGLPTLNLDNGSGNITVDEIIEEGLPRVIKPSADHSILIT